MKKGLKPIDTYLLVKNYIEIILSKLYIGDYMIKCLIRKIIKISRTIFMIDLLLEKIEQNKILQAKILCEYNKKIDLFADIVEFSVFSQFGDDGIIQWLINNLNIENKYFVEFGVEDYLESNTRFLMINNNWSGFVMDGCESNVNKIINSSYYWKYDLTAKQLFITQDNINNILKENCPREIGLLHIDLDGNDFWIWSSISVISPVIVILEYNSVFGSERTITVPYYKDFNRTKYHYSNLYWGASLKSLVILSKSKGYSFIGCNNAGNNAYFIRKDKLNDKVKEISIENGFVNSKYRESRNTNGEKSYLSGLLRKDLIKGLKVYNTVTNLLEEI